MNQQQNKECQQNDLGDGEKQKDISNNVTPSTSPPFIVCGNAGNFLSTPSTSNNNNNININAIPSTEYSSTTTTVEIEPPTKTKPNQQIKILASTNGTH